ncbi:MAG: Gfo/Idh/MocA family protein [Armatimonadota bacterium]
MQPIRIMIVGCGYRSTWFSRALNDHPAYDLVALVDVLPEVARVLANDIDRSDLPVYAEVEEALDAVDVDAVVVATSDSEHTGPVLAALARGKYVYVEKPLALTLDDCKAMIEADEAAGHRTMVGFNLRFAPLYRHMHRLINEGAVGKVLTIQADEFYYGGRTYFRRWNRLRSFGGGLWITKASHDFDQLYWLAGSLPTRVSACARLTHYVPKPEAGIRCSECAIEAKCPDSDLRMECAPLFREMQRVREAAGWPPADLCVFNAEKDTFDHGIAQVEFENDTLATYAVNVVSSFTDRRIRVAGEEGILEGRLSKENCFYWKRHEVDSFKEYEEIPLADPKTIGDMHGGGDQRILASFADFVHGNAASAVAPAEAAVAIALGLAATHSSDTGAAIELANLSSWNAICERLMSKA